MWGVEGGWGIVRERKKSMQTMTSLAATEATWTNCIYFGLKNLSMARVWSWLPGPTIVPNILFIFMFDGDRVSDLVEALENNKDKRQKQKRFCEQLMLALLHRQE